MPLPDFKNFEKKKVVVENPLFNEVVERYKEKLAEFHTKLNGEFERGVLWLHGFFVQGTKEMWFQSQPFMNIEFLFYAEEFLTKETNKIEGVEIDWKIQKFENNGNPFYIFWLHYSSS